MPVDACQFFYECSSCKTVLKPKHGDYCVFVPMGRLNVRRNSFKAATSLGRIASGLSTLSVSVAGIFYVYARAQPLITL
jgi:hypothetical protein